MAIATSCRTFSVRVVGPVGLAWIVASVVAVPRRPRVVDNHMYGKHGSERRDHQAQVYTNRLSLSLVPDANPPSPNMSTSSTSWHANDIVHPHNLTLTRGAACAIAFLLGYATFGLSRLICDCGRNGRVGSVKVHLFLAPVLPALDVVLAASAIAVDSAIEAIIVIVLPELRHGGGNGGLGLSSLVFARPILAISVVVLLPLWLQSGLNRGRIATAMGLALLSIACLVLAMSISFLGIMVGQVMSAMASAAIITPALHTVIVEAPADRVGLHLSIPVTGISVGFAGGPWLGSVLHVHCGLPGMMAALGLGSAAMCCLIVYLSRHVGDFSAVGVARPSDLDCCQESLLQVFFKVLFNSKRCTLIAGIGLSAGVLALHSVILPLGLGGLGYPHAGAPSCTQIEGAVGVVLALSSLVPGTLVDRMGEQLAVCGLVAVLVLNVLGLRAIVEGVDSDQPLVALGGLIASRWSLGAYLGVAMPLLLRLECSRGANLILQTSAVVSASFGVAWFLGGTLGVYLQLVLYHWLGCQRTVIAFAMVLLVHAIVLLIAPGWLRSQSAALSKKGGMARDNLSALGLGCAQTTACQECDHELHEVLRARGMLAGFHCFR